MPIAEFRTKREAVKKAHYKLHTEYENLTPFGLIGKYLSQTAKQVKNKNRDKSLVFSFALQPILPFGVMLLSGDRLHPHMQFLLKIT